MTDTDTTVLIKLGRRFKFNVLPVHKIKETEKAIQFGSNHSDQTIWFPKKALKETEIDGIMNLAAWFTFDSWGNHFLGDNMRIAITSF